ncbi:MAG: phage Gp37/Gp68 family protein [Gaiellaceae bacterium]
MADRSRIEWTEATWNPVTGCSKLSPGCAHCYAETLSLRFGRSLKPWTPANAAENIVIHPDRLKQPLSWRRPRMIFVNSMSDLFHELVPVSFVQSVFDVMAAAQWHTFQVLTKRPERAAEIADALTWSKNVWLGVSIENSRFTWRADLLREIDAKVRFISAEPLLGSLIKRGARKRSLNLKSIDWLIAGGESGPHYRPVNIEWVRELRQACAANRVAFFFKQWGGRTPKSGGRELDGRTYDELPEGQFRFG